ncbi:hypothetical protein WIW50_10095 [Flavobacteriaceae bacterium 3-367]
MKASGKLNGWMKQVSSKKGKLSLRREHSYIMKNLIKYTSFTSCTLFIACTNTTYFSEDDLAWMDVYNEKDTLIFQEVATLKRDTTIITKKEIYHPGFQPIARDGLIPHSADLWYWNQKHSNLDYPNARLLEMYKDDDNIPSKPWVTYLGFSFDVSGEVLEFNNVSLSLTNKNFSKVYIFESKKHRLHREEQNRNPQILYWDKEYGIIKYEDYDGNVWERINW